MRRRRSDKGAEYEVDDDGDNRCPKQARLPSQLMQLCLVTVDQEYGDHHPGDQPQLLQQGTRFGR